VRGSLQALGLADRPPHPDPLPLKGEREKNRCAVRLGFRQIQGLAADEITRLIAARRNGYAGIEQLAAVSGVSRFTIERLAEADAFRSLGLDRRAALWAARRLDTIGIARGTAKASPAPAPSSLLAAHRGDQLFPEPAVALPPMSLAEHVAEDYVATSLSLKEHPVTFFRHDLTRLGALRNAEQRGERLRNDQMVTVAGLVLIRQQPGTAKGVIFMTLEDETDIANIIVWPKVFAKNRRIVMTARFLAVRGRLQRAGLVVHVVAQTFVDLSAELRRLTDGDLPSPDPQGELPLGKSRDFH
jgi:error-prone DNA polymerase